MQHNATHFVAISAQCNYVIILPLAPVPVTETSENERACYCLRCARPRGSKCPFGDIQEAFTMLGGFAPVPVTETCNTLTAMDACAQNFLAHLAKKGRSERKKINTAKTRGMLRSKLLSVRSELDSVVQTFRWILYQMCIRFCCPMILIL